MYFIGEEELDALKKLFERKKLYRYNADYNSECDQFESEFSKWTGSKHSLLLSSGTNALVAALIASGIKSGDEVLIPSYTFVATAAAVAQVGAIPVIININSRLSLDFVEAAIKVSPSTKAVILVHMDGLAADLSGAADFCQKHNLVLIEDAAQAIGGSCEGKILGTTGQFGCFSLNESKIISCGEGGILISSDTEKFKVAFSYHDTPAQFSPSRKEFLSEVPAISGSSMRVSEIQGSIMRVQLRRLSDILLKLRERKFIFSDVLSINSRAHLVEGYCKKGDCATTLHLQFSDPALLPEFFKKTRDFGLLFTPVTARPAHASWKWSHLYGSSTHADVISSIDILMRTVKMDINIESGLEETELQAQNLLKILT